MNLHDERTRFRCQEPDIAAALLLKATRPPE